MKPAQIKIVLVSTAIVAGIALLAVESSRSATVYYQTLPEYQQAPPAKAVRITGYVEQGSIQRAAGEPLLFMMVDKEKTTRMAVAFRDIVPDTFKDGAEVVVEGRMDDAQVFQASTLLAKCPSKYESSEQEKGGAAAPRA